METRIKPLHPIQERDNIENMNYVDLGPFYNFALSEEIHGKPGNTIGIPTGINDFVGVKFDTRGIIQLASSVSFEKSHINYPKVVTGIPVNHFADRISFLHSSAWESKTGSEVVWIVVNYANNLKQTITIKYRVEVEDWWFQPAVTLSPPSAIIAWEGSNKRVNELGFALRLYHYSWINPIPDIAVKSIDLISAMNGTGYMLYAVTCH